MAAPKKNKNAEKWSDVKSLDLFNKADMLVKRKTNYIVNGKSIEGYEFDFIGELADELEVYRDLLQRDIPSRFPQLKGRYTKLKNRLETNCYSNTKKGIINTAVGIVNLKSNHGWTDRQQTDVTTGGDKINLTPISFVGNKD